MSLLKYYLDRGISPVHYLASSMAEHLERRQSLYNMLGLSGQLFSNAKILEIGAGSGQNSLYVAAQRPSKYVIVEPNPVALKQIEETYENFSAPHTRPYVVPLPLEDYPPGESFDIVICEGWLGSSSHERSLVGDIASRVKPGGMMILTALSISGWLSNLIRYCLIQKLLVDKSLDYDLQVAIALAALSPHLKTISGMTRSHEDWIKDNMVNPTYLDQGLTLGMILREVSPRGFTVFGASPDFITEWRWFKQLHGDNLLTNENALECYERCLHNFLDYRRIFGERDPALNRRLGELSVDLLNALSVSKTKTLGELRQAYFDSIARILKQMRGNLGGVAKYMSAAIDEAVELLDAPKVEPFEIAAMENYRSWFGRETLYFSFLHSTDQPWRVPPDVQK